jgi:hypothetical protein
LEKKASQTTSLTQPLYQNTDLERVMSLINYPVYEKEEKTRGVILLHTKLETKVIKHESVQQGVGALRKYLIPKSDTSDFQVPSNKIHK